MNLLSARAVAERLSVSRAYVYKLMRDHDFPSPVKMGSRSAWRQDEVDAWVTLRSEARAHG